MKVVLLIRSDPRQSHRAAEGLRIALGLAIGGHQIDMILVGEARHLLDADIEHDREGEMIQKFLLELRARVPAFYVWDTPADTQPQAGVVFLSEREVAERVAAANRWIRF